MMSLSLVVLALCGSAAAQTACDLSDFARHPAEQPAVRSPVSDLPHGTFEWGTETWLEHNAYWWRRNFIWNLDERNPLPVIWDKGGLRFSTWYPLTSRFPACTKTIIGQDPDVRPRLDLDAPIDYGQARRSYRASVFAVDSADAEGKAISKINHLVVANSQLQTSYVEQTTNTLRNLQVVLWSSEGVGKYELQIFLEGDSDGLTIGIGGLSRLLGRETFVEITEQARSQQGNSSVASIDKFSGGGVAEDLRMSADDKDIQGEFLFLSGNRVKTNLSYEVPSGVIARREPAFMVVLDSYRRAIVAGNFDLVVPASAK